MNGALLVTGTASDAGKSTLVAGLCRWLARQGVRVAPFKAQNMALNAAVTADGGEIGRAQAFQAAACGVPPETAMNPVLLKPTGERTTQVIVRGRPALVTDAGGYQRHKTALLPVVLEAFGDLRRRFEVVICEGAGSPAETNLRDGDLVNMGLARAAGLPVVLVGDIERGGVFAALYGTLGLLDATDAALVRGFVINRFRGDPAILQPGLDDLTARTGRPVLGVLPHVEGLHVDAEDSLALARYERASAPPCGRDRLTVAAVRLPRISNFTDLDALACEAGVEVAVTASAAVLRHADLVVLPGTKATVADLAWLRDRGLDRVLAERAAAGAPVLGICGGYQMLGTVIDDPVESGAGQVAGLGLLPVRTAFAPDKVLRRPTGVSAWLGPVSGYEIRHGRVHAAGGTPVAHHADGTPEGCVHGVVVGTTWHGLLEGDTARRALLAWVAEVRGLDFTAGTVTFAAVREAQIDVLADLVDAHLDTGAVAGLLSQASLAAS